uniref:Uncharacterized protein n=1 Tax=Schizaphis graminum TaxID=13262 RepID=A0A2S2PSC4_SCHGA
MRKVTSARPTQTNSSKMLLPQYTKRRRQRPNLSFFFFCLFVYTTFYYYYYYYVYATYVKIYRCRVESTSGVVKRTVFSLHKEVGTPYTYTACTIVHYSVHVLYTYTHTHTHIYHGCAKIQ